MPEEGPTPEHINGDRSRVLGGQTLLSGVKLGVFTELDRSGPPTVEELEDTLGIHPRSSRDFLDALVALNLLNRDDGYCRNTPESNAFLVEQGLSSLSGWFEMVNDRLYPFWGDLEEALRTGRPTNELEDDQTHSRRPSTETTRIPNSSWER